MVDSKFVLIQLKCDCVLLLNNNLNLKYIQQMNHFVNELRQKKDDTNSITSVRLSHYKLCKYSSLFVSVNYLLCIRTLSSHMIKMSIRLKQCTKIYANKCDKKQLKFIVYVIYHFPHFYHYSCPFFQSSTNCLFLCCLFLCFLSMSNQI